MTIGDNLVSVWLKQKSMLATWTLHYRNKNPSSLLNVKAKITQTEDGFPQTIQYQIVPNLWSVGEKTLETSLLRTSERVLSEK